MCAVAGTSTLASSGSLCARSWRGFTLIELMTTVIVLAVSLALAAPALSSFVRANRLNAAQSELVSSLMLARSEAARVGVPARVEALQPVANDEFGHGWRVWVDANGNNALDADESLREVPDRGGDVTISTAGGVQVVVFNPTGFLSPVTPVSFDVRGVNGSAKRYCVQLTPVGLADVSELACP